MTDRKLFGTNTLINEFIQKLTEVDTLDGGWATKYIDNSTGQYWIKYVVDDRNFVENLMLVSPPPRTDELIDIALSSKHSDEVLAAAARLYFEEQTDKREFRKNLVDKLNQIDLEHFDQIEKERIKTIIKGSQLTDRVNKRDIVGKHFSEIQKDADFFNLTADRAQEILNML
ncbi:MAG: hypothetical protein WDO19_04605 [Bacteroidota bacterium]